MKKKITITLVAFLTLVTMAIPIAAATQNVLGGRWEYGVDSYGGYVYSYYSHALRTHGSSVQGNYYLHSGWKKGGTPAYATASMRLYGGNQSYYSFP